MKTRRKPLPAAGSQGEGATLVRELVERKRERKCKTASSERWIAALFELLIDCLEVVVPLCAKTDGSIASAWNRINTCRARMSKRRLDSSDV
jgi:hypothetical protein